MLSRAQEYEINDYWEKARSQAMWDHELETEDDYAYFIDPHDQKIGTLHHTTLNEPFGASCEDCAWQWEWS